jgi:hypothetical protein
MYKQFIRKQLGEQVTKCVRNVKSKKVYIACHNLNYFEVKCELRCVVDIFTL